MNKCIFDDCNNASTFSGGLCDKCSGVKWETAVLGWFRMGRIHFGQDMPSPVVLYNKRLQKEKDHNSLERRLLEVEKQRERDNAYFTTQIEQLKKRVRDLGVEGQGNRR